MTGIRSYGIYLPGYQLERKSISRAWDFPKAPGTKSVANIDEDSITMAVEAGLDCLAGIDPKEIDGLYFASTTPPFSEKQNASLIAKVLDLRDDIQTADITTSTKCGTEALREAFNTVEAGNAKNILIVIADKRDAEIQTMDEFIYGDGAAAVLVSSDDAQCCAKIEGYHSITTLTTGPWRKEGDPHVNSFEIKHETMYGYMKSMTSVLAGLMKKYEINPDEVAKAIYYSPDPRSHGRILKAMKLSTKAAVDSMFMQISNTGSPLPFQMMYMAFEKCPSNATVLLAGYGDGADAFYLKTTDKIKDVVNSKTKSRKLFKEIKTIENYNTFLKNRLVIKGKEFFTRKASAVTIWRDSKSLLPFYGVKCNNCGYTTYPIMPTCLVCRSTDFEEVRLQRKGKIFTYTLDHLVAAEYVQTPVPRCVIDLEGGGRVLLDMTDCNPEDAAIDIEVGLTFRKVNEGGGSKNYYWKCRPIASKKKDKEVEA
ncbi:MAG: hydroxymethylglutaryl-CoA synthase family protein [Candidatus Lokiarchaeota archaeon]|nr:hydroxymethylglutaryl-CoA synthase family protein [Candidatus Lokiarchaeota archaeon]